MNIYSLTKMPKQLLVLLTMLGIGAVSVSPAFADDPTDSMESNTEIETPIDGTSTDPEIETPIDGTSTDPEIETPIDGTSTDPEIETPIDGTSTDPEIETPIDGTSTDPEIETPIDGTSTDMETPIDGTSTDMETPIDGTSTDMETPIDGTSTDPEIETPIDGTSTDPEIETPIDGTSTDMETPIDGTSTDMETPIDGTSTDMETPIDGTSTDVETPIDGTATEAGNIVEVASGSENFNTLVQAIQAAGLGDTLSDSSASYTVFAPTDEAFSQLPDGTLEYLLQPENQEILQQVLSYHVLPEKVTSEEISGGSVDSLAGGLATAVTDRGVVINNASVIDPDIQASNGVIHGINRVLLPADLQSTLASELGVSEADIYQ